MVLSQKEGVTKKFIPFSKKDCWRVRSFETQRYVHLSSISKLDSVAKAVLLALRGIIFDRLRFLRNDLHLRLELTCH